MQVGPAVSFPPCRVALIVQPRRLASNPCFAVSQAGRQACLLRVMSRSGPCSSRHVSELSAPSQAWYRQNPQVHSVRMAQSAGRLCELLEGAAAPGAEVDMWRSMGQLTMNVVGSTVFG